MGLLKWELVPGFRLGTEMADRARFWGKVSGIFHTDEMPAYGVTAGEVEEIRKVVGAEEQDTVVFVADQADNAREALKAVVGRAREALRGVPEETRVANQDGTTRYMRPRPGAARMYPETDIPPIEITEEYVNEISSSLPEFPEQKLERVMKEYKLNQKLAKQIIDSEHSELFETSIKETGISPTLVAVFLTETLKAMKRDGAQVDRISENQMKDIFKNIASGNLMKESITEVATWLSKNEGRSVQEAIKALGLKTVSNDDLMTLIEKAIADNGELIKEKGEASFGILMGMIMKNLRGKIDAAQVSKVLREKLGQVRK
jgi:glutamyl-tRNA(Gln) amidotransferase subunit E